MKTLLISTDFSAIAAHAAEYGYNLAKQIKADAILCNAITVSAKIPQAGVVVWPMEEYNVLTEETINIKNSNTESGLDWLCEHGQVDMLATVHR